MNLAEFDFSFWGLPLKEANRHQEACLVSALLLLAVGVKRKASQESGKMRFYLL